jgi:carboxypeptidase PM20D1
VKEGEFMAEDALAAVKITPESAAHRLRAYIRLKTTTPPRVSDELAARVIRFFVENYASPLGLETEVFDGRSLLLRWRSPSAKKRPLAFLGHYDVVPVPENELSCWTHPPFEGIVRDGYVWGRGALDMKGSTICILEAIAALRRSGLEPERSVVVLLNPDEEFGGKEGAALFAARHLGKLEAPEALFDEASFIIPDLLPGKIVAAVAVGEKTYWTIKLSVETKSGHAGMPSPDDAPAVLVKALARFQTARLPEALLPATRMFLDRLADHLPFPRSLVLKNRRFFWGLIKKTLGKNPAMNALLRATQALTIVSAGIKDNVIPRRAEAFVNLRLLPGQTREAIMPAIKKAVGDERVRIEDWDFWGETPVAAVDGPFWERLEQTLAGVIPGGFAAPIISPVTTDSRFFARSGIPSYRFVPFTLDAKERQGAHGVDERISLANIEQAVRIYAHLMYDL